VHYKTTVAHIVPCRSDNDDITIRCNAPASCNTQRVVEGADRVVLECRDTHRRVVPASGVFKECFKTDSNVGAAGRVEKECRVANSCVHVTGRVVNQRTANGNVFGSVSIEKKRTASDGGVPAAGDVGHERLRTNSRVAGASGIVKKGNITVGCIVVARCVVE
jgi:hypothetical protein